MKESMGISKSKKIRIKFILVYIFLSRIILLSYKQGNITILNLKRFGSFRLLLFKNADKIFNFAFRLLTVDKAILNLVVPVYWKNIESE